jgi:hypothetical protein
MGCYGVMLPGAAHEYKFRPTLLRYTKRFVPVLASFVFKSYAVCLQLMYAAFMNFIL